MYTFELKYYDFDLDEMLTELIEIDGQFFKKELDIILYATKLGYNKLTKHQSFCGISFLSS